MPVVRRALTDIFDLAHVVDVMVNPINLQGAMGAGLALEFKNRHPQMYERYRHHCLVKKDLHIGKIQTYKDPQTPYIIVNLPTKRHYADASDPEDIKRGLHAMRRWLEESNRKLYTVAMPMLGCGLGNQDYATMEPIFFDYLDGLDNVIHLSMLPTKMDHIPKYLGIIGPRYYADHREYDDVANVTLGVTDALRSWGLDWSDFDAIVSGGALGVDKIACGSDRKDASYTASLAKQYHSNPPIICKADWNRFGHSAGMIRNRTVVNIVTHLVAILPPGLPAVGTSGAVAHFRNVNKNLPLENQKFLYIHGEEQLRQKESVRDRLIAPVA
jgi:O-acetyl-ADP-ribose deacetylase (regulator of RNase III)